jgi:hypothetical protein
MFWLRMSANGFTALLLAAMTLAACRRPSSPTIPAPAASADTEPRFILIRGHTGPPFQPGPGAIAYAADSALWCPRTDSTGVVWPPVELPISPALIDSTVVLRGPEVASYAKRCGMPLDAVVHIRTRKPTSPDSS